jgi:hypothetical protein
MLLVAVADASIDVESEAIRVESMERMESMESVMHVVNEAINETHS